MKIIDWTKKGNSIRFYLGADDCTDYWGDDWNDTPYDCNAGEVYEEFVTGYRDVAFSTAFTVLEPADDWQYTNVPYCKDDLKERKVPCIIVVYDDDYGTYDNCYSDALNSNKVVQAYYFGDSMQPGEDFFTRM